MPLAQPSPRTIDGRSAVGAVPLPIQSMRPSRPMTVDLRRARLDDAEERFAVQREAALSAYAHIFSPDRYALPDEEVPDEWGAILAAAGSQPEVIVAEAGGETVGVAGRKAGYPRKALRPAALVGQRSRCTTTRGGVGGLAARGLWPLPA
jgi:hypothetical protein